MTLAAIFLLSIFCNLSVSSSPTSSGYLPDAAVTSVAATDPQTESGTTQTQPQNPTDAKPSSSPATGAKDSATQPPAKLVHHKKRRSAGCSTTPSPQSSAATPNTTPSGTPTAGAPSGQATGGGKGANDCPPSKVVVRQGGTTDPPIQLAGGQQGGQASQVKATANQMLESTDGNLKKLEGRQLSSTEQDMVTQIKQYMEQSKVAVTAGDSDRARNLAWKAQTLSEELIKPAQ